MKLSEIAKINGGIVVARIDNKMPNIKYKMLANKYIDEFGNVKDAEEVMLEVAVDEKYLTKDNDIIFKASFPNSSIYISDPKNFNMLVPSYFHIIRILNTSFLPEYINIFFNTPYFADLSEKLVTGTVLKSLKISQLYSVDIPELSLEKQKEIIEFNRLVTNEKMLYKNILKEKENLNNKILDRLIRGKKQ